MGRGARMALVLDKAAEAAVDRLEESVGALELPEGAEDLEDLDLELEQAAPELEPQGLQQPVVAGESRQAPQHNPATRGAELDLAQDLGGEGAAAALRSLVVGPELGGHLHQPAVLEEGGAARAPQPSPRLAMKASAPRASEGPSPARAMELHPEGPREASLDPPRLPAASEAQEPRQESTELQEGLGLEALEASAPMASVTTAASLGTTGGGPGSSAPRCC